MWDSVDVEADPEGYLLGASALATDPADTLVFEDSQAGLLAASAAGSTSARTSGTDWAFG